MPPVATYARGMASVPAQPVERRRASLRLRADGDEIRHLLATGAGRLLVVAVGAIAALTLIGLLALWPYGWKPLGEPVATTVSGKVTRVSDASCGGTEATCRTIDVAVEGRETTLWFPNVRNAPAVGVGDSVRLTRGGDPNAAPSGDGSVAYHFAEVDRRSSLLWLALLLAGVAAAALRWRGILAIAGVVLSVGVVLWFVVPAILAGRPALLVALVASLAVTFVTILLTNGLGIQSLAGLLGVSGTLALTCAIAWLAVRFADLDGSTELDMLGIKAGSDVLSRQGIILAGMIIGALGVLADTAVTQASAVMALRRANPRYGPRDLYREGFTIGRDHLSATIHTLVLAYTGGVLPLLLTLRLGNVDGVDALNGQSIAEPIVATVVGCLALIAAIPVTTGLASMLLSRLPVEALPEGHDHHH
jgi:uncharacterized membrane protein